MVWSGSKQFVALKTYQCAMFTMSKAAAVSLCNDVMTLCTGYCSEMTAMFINGRHENLYHVINPRLLTTD